MKLIKVIVVVLVLAVAGYVGYWFYQSGNIKAAIETNLDQASKAIAEDGGELTHGGVSASGFPFAFDFAVADIKATFPGKKDDKPEGATGLQIRGETVLSMGVFSSGKASISFPTEVVLSADKDGKREELTTTYNENPTIDVEFDGVSYLDLVANKGPQTFGEWKQAFRHVHYRDNGSTMVDSVSGKPILNGGGVEIDIAYRPEAEKMQLSFLVKAQDSQVVAEEGANLGELAKEWVRMYKDLGKFNATFDVAYEGPKDPQALVAGEAKLEIREVSVNSDKFSFQAKGAVNKAADDLLPYGNVAINLGNFETLVDSIIGSLHQQHAAAQIAEGLEPVSQQIITDQATTVKHFLRRVSDKPEDTANPNIVITIAREKGTTDAKVGTLNSTQMGELTQETSQKLSANTSGAPAEQPVEQNTTTLPTVAPADAVTPPAAGEAPADAKKEEVPAVSE
ncbi:MAG: hypothetical protein K0R63_1559 [Rickettsiales bacterium]|jgi:hypothetical protein|nr:hypothetical protein [Rickettsiales bacterium]